MKVQLEIISRLFPLHINTVIYQNKGGVIFKFEGKSKESDYVHCQVCSDVGSHRSTQRPNFAVHIVTCRERQTRLQCHVWKPVEHLIRRSSMGPVEVYWIPVYQKSVVVRILHKHRMYRLSDAPCYGSMFGRASAYVIIYLFKYQKYIPPSARRNQ